MFTIKECVVALPMQHGGTQVTFHERIFCFNLADLFEFFTTRSNCKFYSYALLTELTELITCKTYTF